MKKLVTLLVLSLTSLQLHADLQQDIDLLRTLAPAGSDVAKYQEAIGMGATHEEALGAAANSYLIRDLTGDGIKDVVVIFEAAKAVPANPDDYVSAGKRTIQFFQGSGKGTYDLISSNDQIVLAADEGGAFGEPLVGLEVNKKGSVMLMFYGGSAWRWGFTYTLQYRKNDLYWIGWDEVYGWNGDGRFESTSVNLLTGRVVDSESKGEGHATKYKVSRRARQPLVSLGKIKNQYEF